MDASSLYRLDDEPLIERLLAEACEKTGAGDAALYLQSGESDQLYKCRDTSSATAFNLPLRLKLEESKVIGSVFINGITRTFSKSRFKILREMGIDVILCSALKKEDAPFGVLAAIKSDTTFSRGDSRTLEELVEVYSPPLEQALYRKAASDRAVLLSKLNEISEVLLGVRQDGQELRRIIAEQARDLLGADLTALYIYDEREDDLVIPPYVSGDLRDDTFLNVKGPRHKNSLAIQLVRAEKPFYASIAAEDWHYDAGRLNAHHSAIFPEREGIVSSAGIPLKAGDTMLGVLFINYRTYSPFSHDQRESIRLFTQLAALALQNATSYQRQVLSVSQLKILNDLGHQINSSDNVNEIFPVIHEHTNRFMDAANFYVATCDEESGMLYFPYAVENHCRIDNLPEAYKPRPLGNGLTEYVLQNKKSLLILDDEDEILKRHRMNVGGSACKSWLGVPLVVEERVLGVIVVHSFEKTKRFDESDRELLLTMAAQVAPLIARMQVLEELTRNQAEFLLLGDATLAISAETSLEERLDKIVGDASRLFEAQGGKIYLADAKSKKLILRAVHGLTSGTLNTGDSVDYGCGLSGQVILNKEPLFTNDYRNYPHRLREQEGSFRSVIGVPLRLGAEDECIGVLSIFDAKGSRKFTESDIAKVQRFANYAALAIRDAGHRSDLQQQVERFRIINNITQAISTTSNLEAYFDQIVATIREQLDCDHCTFFLRKEKEDGVYLEQEASVSIHPTPPKNVRFNETEGLAGLAFREGESRVFQDIATHPAFVPLEGLAYEFESMLAAIVRIGDKKIGLITADSRRADAFTDADVEWVDALTSNIAISLENAGASHMQQVLSKQLLGAMVEGDPDFEVGMQGLLRQIVTKSIDLLQGSSAIIYLLSEDKATITARYCLPGKEHHHPIPRQNERHEFVGITGLVIKHKTEIVIPDVREDDRVTPDLHRPIKSLAAFPLKVDENVIGVLYVDHLRPRRLTAIEIRFMTMIADLAALAIDKYTLVSRMARTRESARTVAGQALIQDWDKTLTTLLDGAASALGGDAICLFIYDPAREEFEYPFHEKGVWNRDAMFKPHVPVSDNSTLHRILDLQESLYLTTDAQHDAILAGGFVEREQIKSAAVAQLLVEENGERRIVGLMFINYRTAKHEFSKEEREDIELFASLAAATIRSAQLYKKLNRIRDTARQFANENLRVSENLEKKLISVAMGIKETLECDVVSVHTYVREQNKFLGEYAEAGEFAEMTGPNPKAPQPQILFDILESESVCTTDDPAYRDLLLGPFTQRQSIQATAALPLGEPGAPVGVLFVSYRRPHRFSEEEIRDIQLFGDQSAIAISNAQLFDRNQRERDRYEALLQNSPNPIIAIDEAGRITYSNSHVEDILGYSAEQLRDKTVDDLYWGGRKEARVIKERLTREHTIYRKETYVRHKDGDRIPILLSAAVLPQVANTPRRTVSIGIIEDQRVVALKGRMRKFFDVISEINQRQDLKEILDDLFDRVFGLFSSCEAGCIFLRENNQLKMVAEFPPLARTNGDLSIAYGEGLIGSIAATDDQAFVELPPYTDKKGHVVVRVRRQDGSESMPVPDDMPFPFSTQSRSAVILPIRRDHQTLGVLYLESRIRREFSPNDDLLPLLTAQAAVAIERANYRDIQERWRKTNEEMFASSKAIVAAQIASSFLHEVKNLLHSISVNIRVFKGLVGREAEIKKKKPYYERIEAVERSVLQAARLANESQRFKESLTAHRELHYLNSIVQETLQQVETVLKKKKLTFEPKWDAALDRPDTGSGNPVELDRDLIILVIINLILNAVEASNERSKIVVSTHRRENDVVLRVTDFGKGIAPGDLETIFEPFFTRRKGSGVGLGLFVCKNVVEQHAGYIHVESKAGKTVFSVHLPYTFPRK